MFHRRKSRAHLTPLFRVPAVLRLLPLVVFALVLQTASAFADTLSFAPVFTKHMVLQRDQSLRVWGHATAGAEVSLSVAGKTETAKADADGKWRVTVPALSAGGPFEVVASAGEETAKLADVLVGDVWLCSGQSNMQFALKDATHAHEAVAAAVADRKLRLMTVPNIPSTVPTDRVNAPWAVPTEKLANEFAAPAIFFALALHRSSPAMRDVPIGLINSSLGGSWVEYWIPAEPALPRGEPKPVSLWGVKPTYLYNGMIAPLAGLNLKGALWYQGESNAPRPGQYSDLLRKMIAVWRNDFQNPTLPFYVVQLPGFADNIDQYSFTGVRDAQAQVAASEPNVHLAVTIDSAENYLLHPHDKKLVGDRLALLARRYSYGEDVVADGPIFKSAAAQGDAMRVTFDTHGSALTAVGDLNGFELAGADDIYWRASAQLDGSDAVLVRSDRVPSPQFVRYAWQAAPHASLTNSAGLPAGPFRTDKSPPATMMEVQEVPLLRRLATKKYTATLNPGGWLTGLLVDGHQFLSPDSFGGFVPLSGFGPFPLPNCTQSSATQIAFDDGHLRFNYRFEPGALHIDIHNGNATGDMPIRCMLASNIEKLADFKPNQPTPFGFHKTRVTIEGIDHCEKSNEGNYDLQTRVPAGQTKTIAFRMDGR